MSVSAWVPAVCRPARSTALFRPRRSPPWGKGSLPRPFSVSSSVLTASPSPPTPQPAAAASEPLRILFCGSDDFSCASLQALHDEMQRQHPHQKDEHGIIESLDVVVRPAKRTGRGRKTTQESPVKTLATSLGLRVHERDTFTGWQPPSVNLIVAVSFGLFVPARLIRGARYGGVNVHPSLLPDLHGATPIEHAILLGRTRTGITVQTLDDKKFDGGRILLQGPGESMDPNEDANEASASEDPNEDAIEASASEDKAIGIHVPPRCTAPELRQILAPMGAHLLVQTLRKGLYLDGAASAVPASSLNSRTCPTAAPRLSKADQEVPWRQEDHETHQTTMTMTTTTTTTAVDVDRRFRALGPLWTHVVPPAKASQAGQTNRDGGGQTHASPTKAPPPPKRIILDDLEPVACPAALLSVLVQQKAAAASKAGPHTAKSDARASAAAAAASSPSPLRTVTFVQQNTREGGSQRHVTLPFVVDETGDSMILPVGVSLLGDESLPSSSADGQTGKIALRIGTLKAEGDRTKPAGRAITAFSTGESFGQISWDVVAL